MPLTSRARVAFVLLYGTLLLWQIDRWLLTPHGLPSTWGWRHGAQSAPLNTPGGVEQTFTMGADGLDGVWLRLSTSGVPRGDLVVDLHAVRDEARVRLERVALPAPTAASTRDIHVSFRQIRASRGQTFAITLRHLNAADGPGLHVATTREDTLERARFIVDGREQWGDLVFETSSARATLPYWIHELLRPWPKWVASAPAVVATLVAFNLLLAWACAHAVGMLGPPPSTTGERTPGRASWRVRPIALAAAAVVAVGGVVWAARPTGRFRATDLIEALPEARIATSWPTLHAGVTTGPVLFGDRVHRSIVAMPTTTIAWDVEVPQGAVFRAGAAMRPDVWEKRSDGIQMRVWVEHAAGRDSVADLTLFPMGVPEHRRLVPLEVPLTRWAGQRITLVLESTPERWGNAVNDVPVWTSPRIEWPRAGRVQ